MLSYRGPFLKDVSNLVMVSTPIPRGMVYFDKPTIPLTSTILDPNLATNGGYIRLPKGAMLYIPDEVRVFAPRLPATISPKWVKEKVLPDHANDLVFTVEDNTYLYLPKGTESSFELQSGMKVLGDLQRAANALVEAVGTYSRASSAPWSEPDVLLQTAFSSYFSTIENELFYKGGMLDCMVASVLSFTARGVLVNDASLAPNQVKIPYAVARKWVRLPEFREAYSLEGSDPQAINGFRILVGRQPTHRYTNLFSMKIVVSHPSQVSFGMNPLVVNLFNGDFDGDTVHVLMPSTAEGRADLPKMSIEKLFPISKPGKELKGLSLPTDGGRASLVSSATLAAFTEGELLGFSCNWKDLVGKEGGTGYYNDTDKAQMASFTGWARGEHHSLFEDQSEAMLDYRIIKGGEARAGGLSNSIQAMCLAKVWDDPDQEKASEQMRLVGDLKHALCQAPLDAKHGGVSEENFQTLSTMFYNPPMAPFSTKEEYRAFMVEKMELPAKSVDFVLNTFFGFSNPLKNINEVLQDVNPQFVLTRRQASTVQLPKFAELSKRPISGLHSLFIYRGKSSMEVEDENKEA